MKFLAGEFDVAVIGAGHAGIEAGLAAARLGCKTGVFRYGPQPRYRFCPDSDLPDRNRLDRFERIFLPDEFLAEGVYDNYR